eukprot:CAMPEP_0119092292 /NCGR_PEP_ID=MMETSP1178-20130426/159262_1 /TAXON_ID=33656 /ORGANISM="unid sp, Strain CCMP2000" /LENGTH=112 /DNA_ID=CAMNT_0007075855 /DNA_START=143 /DNA_END=481 /DNA_ORIENTATION=+
MLELKLSVRHWSHLPFRENQQRDGLLSHAAQRLKGDDIRALKAECAQGHLIWCGQRVAPSTLSLEAADVAYEFARCPQAGILGHHPHLMLAATAPSNQGARSAIAGNGVKVE